MIILGIDPGIATTGYGVLKIDKNQLKGIINNKTEKEVSLQKDFYKASTLIDYGCLVTDKTLESGKRLQKLYFDIQELLSRVKPSVTTIERLFFFKNAKTIISVSQAKGVVILASSQADIPILEYTPLQVKSMVTGYGRAKKNDVRKEVKIFLNEKKLELKKGQKTKDGYHLDDAVDALAVAICHTLKMYST